MLFALALAGTGCATGELTARQSFNREENAGCDRESFAACAGRMARCVEVMQTLRTPTRRHRHFLSPRDQDLLERSLAEYLYSRHELEQIAERQQLCDPQFSYSTRRVRTEHDVRLASLVVEDPVLWRAMNQSFHRSNIPRGTCDRLLHTVTASDAAPFAGDIREDVNGIIRRRGVVSPAFENSVRHSAPLELVAATRYAFSDHFHDGQKLVAAGIAPIKNPALHPLDISPDQRSQIRQSLQPGDVLLTYSAGYVSNWFIPGRFKHVATFVGTDEDRRNAGLPSEALLAVAGTNTQRLVQVLDQTAIGSGEAADVVEAVTEGVRLNSFDRMLTSRVSQLVVLRPHLSAHERAEQIADVLSYVGDEFDFSFDLTDASDQICTELVYRSLQGRGGFDLDLTQYAGRRTLLPDDILDYALHRGRDQFTCILAVCEASEKPRILLGAEAHAWIASIQTPKSEQSIPSADAALANRKVP